MDGGFTRVERDKREYPLGFEHPGVPASTTKPMDPEKIEQLVKRVADQVRAALAAGQKVRYDKFPRQLLLSGTDTTDVVSRPQIVFRGERLVIPAGLARFFNIVDIKIGNRSQLANSTAIPAVTFCETAIGVRLALDAATVAMDIALVVENTSRKMRAFRAALIGTAAQ